MRRVTLATLAALAALAVPAHAQDCDYTPEGCAPTPAPAEASRPSQGPPTYGPACAGPRSLTIDRGARFTRDRAVVVTVGGCHGADLSNDGGFGFFGSVPPGDAAWTLELAADERLPQTVYARFFDGQVLTDDIVLDTTPPTIGVAGGAGAAASGARRVRVGRRTFVARDRNGVASLTTRRLKGGRARLTATDRAGNRRTRVVRVRAGRAA